MRLGPYEVLGLIGAGGMGEVYRARDTRLDRTVAIKILPAELSADPDRRTRFEREARAVAALSHPHICTLYDIGTHDGTTYLVMEHLAGETLAQRLTRGPLPVAQALDLAAQIADALDAAHKHGIIHRDLKPGNVMLTGGGSGRSGVTSAKLLDFGLAKLVAHGERPALASGASAATQSLPMTARGSIVGTLQYMAPEQLEGKEADARTDLWALGALLYEMVTGKRAFQADSDVSLIGAILNTEPAGLAMLQPLTPPSLERLVTRCLAKHPDDRWDTAHDVADELRWIATVLPERAAMRPAGRSRWSWRAITVAGVLGLLVGAAGVWIFRPRALAEPTALTNSELSVTPAERLDAGRSDGTAALTRGGAFPALSLSPDGTLLVFVGRQGDTQRLFIRPLAAMVSTPLAGTEGAQIPTFSPDSQWVAFWAAGWLKKVPCRGGPVVSLCQLPRGAPPGLAWGPDNQLIIGASRGGLRRVSSDGGMPTVLTALQPGEISHRLPHITPGGVTVLFTVRRTVWLWGAEEVAGLSLVTGERKTLIENAVDARYLPTGHLVYLRLGTLFAQPFDIKTMRSAGSAVAILDGVSQAAYELSELQSSGGGHFSVSDTGTFVYVPGGVASPSMQQLTLLNRDGRSRVLSAEAGPFAWTPVWTDGGDLVAAVSREPRESALWVLRLSRGTRTRVTAEGEVSWPRWTPDGRRVAFLWRHAGKAVIAMQYPDPSQPAESLATMDTSALIAPSSWSPDGRVLAVTISQADGMYDMGLITLDAGGRSPTPLAPSTFDEFGPEFSPDGKWIAYVANESGRDEVYVRRYPGPGERLQISTQGGRGPAWNPNGRELFYLSLPGERGIRTMMAIERGLDRESPFGPPHKLFEVPAQVTLQPPRGPGRQYDVSGDGSSFLVFQEQPGPAPVPVTHINLIQNWFEELKAKVPAGGAK
jgi:serine/threonine-protein kinase